MTGFYALGEHWPLIGQDTPSKMYHANLHIKYVLKGNNNKYVLKGNSNKIRTMHKICSK